MTSATMVIYSVIANNGAIYYQLSLVEDQIILLDRRVHFRICGVVITLIILPSAIWATTLCRYNPSCDKLYKHFFMWSVIYTEHIS